MPSSNTYILQLLLIYKGGMVYFHPAVLTVNEESNGQQYSGRVGHQLRWCDTFSAHRMCAVNNIIHIDWRKSVGRKTPRQLRWRLTLPS